MCVSGVPIKKQVRCDWVRLSEGMNNEGAGWWKIDKIGGLNGERVRSVAVMYWSEKERNGRGREGVWWECIECEIYRNVWMVK